MRKYNDSSGGSVRLPMCPICWANGEYNTLENQPVFSESFIGKAKACDECGYVKRSDSE